MMSAILNMMCSNDSKFDPSVFFAIPGADPDDVPLAHKDGCFARSLLRKYSNMNLLWADPHRPGFRRSSAILLVFVVVRAPILHSREQKNPILFLKKSGLSFCNEL